MLKTKTKRTKTINYMIQIFLIILFCSNSFSQQKFNKETIKLPLSDGVHLGTDVYLPVNGTNFPTILLRTPYGKYQKTKYAEFWAEHGYAVVLQDNRGKWTSEGEYIPFKHEQKDGLETLDWIVQQDWCNGKIGMYGSSYISYCALTLAASKHPALKTIFNVSGWLKGEKINKPGGTLHLMVALPWILHEETLKKRSLNQYDLDELFHYLPLSNVFSSIGVKSTLWEETEIVMELNKNLSAADIDIPIFHITGWNDFVYPSTLDVYSEVHGSSDKLQKLLIGPWFHDQYYSEYTEVGDEDFGAGSIMGSDKMMELSLQWFDHTLKGLENSISNDPDMKIFVMGKNQWQSIKSWPPENVSLQKWYLSSDSGANSINGDGSLSLTPPIQNTKDSYIFNPINPVPTYGGVNFHFLMDILGIKDQRDIEEREDVLVYSSAPLPETIEIMGPLKVVFYASSEGLDTDFTAKLVEVRENGYARIIEDGIIRASYRNSNDLEEMMEPGKVYQMTIDLGATAIQIQKNHRIRLEISSSNFPKYDRNPNTGEKPMTASKLISVRQQILHGKSHPSHIVLPIVNKPVSKLEK